MYIGGIFSLNMNYMKWKFLGILIILFIIYNINKANAQAAVSIQKIGSEPYLDGNPFEQSWEDVEERPLFMLNPYDELPPSERTSFKIAYSEKYLFVAGFLYDSAPDKIQSTSKRRDDMQLNNDWFGFSLDTYFDKENALDFSTTPVGLRLDMQIFNDGQGDFPVNPDWNVIWDVKTSITDKGWFAEFRIPLSSLRYQVVDGKVTMGLAAFRYIARESEWDTWPEMSNEFGFWSWAKVSNFQTVEFTEIKSVNPLYFSPYVLGGFQQEYLLNEQGSAYEREDVLQRNIGMDVKYGLAKNLTLDLTVNTDFAQVEADDQEVNLTRYSLFFPEKRQFFMERSNVFDFQFGGEGRLFYSRTIGLFDGNQIPLWGGGRLTGRMGDWDIGVLSMQTGSFEEAGERILETSNHSVLRTRRKLPLNKNSYAGFMLTSLYEKSGRHNMGLGLDAILNLTGNTYLNVKLAGTYDEESGENESLLDPTRYQLTLENRTFKGLSYVLHYERAGKNYDPAMGFEFREDFRKMGHHTTWGIIAPEKSRILRMSFGFNGDYFFRNSDNSLETLIVSPAFTMVSKNSEEMSISIPYNQDDVREGFELSDDIFIVPGLYRYVGLKAYYNTSTEKTFFTEFSAYSGTYYGGWQNSISVSPNLSVGNTWKFSGSYQFYRINFSEMNQLYQTHLVRFKAWYMYSTKLSAYANVQFNTLNNSFFINAKIRYNHREGNDLYIVFNDALNTDRMAHVPRLPISDQRTILFKYTHTFRVR
jgi:hypothetical protein